MFLSFLNCNNFQSKIYVVSKSTINVELYQLTVNHITQYPTKGLKHKMQKKTFYVIMSSFLRAISLREAINFNCIFLFSIARLLRGISQDADIFCRPTMALKLLNCFCGQQSHAMLTTTFTE